MAPHLRVEKTIVVSCPAERARAWLQNLETIARYEPKLTQATVHAQNEREGSYDTVGRFAGLPWEGKFSYRLTETGFYSEMLAGPVPGLRVSGGFDVVPLGESLCRVSHYERYEADSWPLLLPLLPFVKLYLSLAMNKELETVRQLLLAEQGGIPPQARLAQQHA